MTPSELASLGAELEELERPKALARKVEGGRIGAEITNKTALGSIDPKADRDQTNDTQNVVASALGLSGSNYGRIKRVVAAAADPAVPAIQAPSTARFQI